MPRDFNESWEFRQPLYRNRAATQLNSLKTMVRASNETIDVHFSDIADDLGDIEHQMYQLGTEFEDIEEYDVGNLTEPTRDRVLALTDELHQARRHAKILMEELHWAAGLNVRVANEKEVPGDD